MHQQAAFSREGKRRSGIKTCGKAVWVVEMVVSQPSVVHSRSPSSLLFGSDIRGDGMEVGLLQGVQNSRIRPCEPG